MKRSYFYIGNIADGAIYYCNGDRNIYLFPPQVTEAGAQKKRTPDLSLLFSGAAVFGYLILRQRSQTFATHFSAQFIFCYCLFSAVGGLGIAFALIGFMRRRMRNNSPCFVLLEKISDNDYQKIRKKVMKRIPVACVFFALMLYGLIDEPFVWQDYTDGIMFFSYFLVWACLALVIYFFSPIQWLRVMKALRRIRTN